MARRITATILATILALAPLAPAQAQFWRTTGLPDTIEFGLRMEMGDMGRAREWLDRGLDPNFIGDRIGTGLMIGAWEGNLPLMELFLARGADVNKTNELGETALMHAAWKGRVEIAKWLLERGAKINNEPRHWTALHYAAFAGQAEVAAFLTARGADLDARSTNGSTPLMMAVYEGKEAMVKQLITLGANRRLRNDYGEGAMDWAFKHERHAIARLVGSTEEFAAAANRPKTDWPQATRSMPVVTVAPTQQAIAPARPDPGREARTQLDGLMRTRATLEARGLDKDVQRLDRRISALRFKLAKPGEDYRRPAVLEISARRKAPAEQDTRLIVDPTK